jgi:hypothetical protein
MLPIWKGLLREKYGLTANMRHGIWTETAGEFWAQAAGGAAFHA